MLGEQFTESCYHYAGMKKVCAIVGLFFPGTEMRSTLATESLLLRQSNLDIFCVTNLYRKQIAYSNPTTMASPMCDA